MIIMIIILVVTGDQMIEKTVEYGFSEIDSDVWV